jgi:hypothetical protein
MAMAASLPFWRALYVSRESSGRKRCNRSWYPVAAEQLWGRRGGHTGSLMLTQIGLGKVPKISVSPPAAGRR